MSSSRPDHPDRSILTWAVVVLVGLTVVGGVLLGVSLLSNGDATPTASPTASTTRATALPTKALDVPSTSVAVSASPTPLPTAAAMQSFIVQYLDTATTDQASAWSSLSPRFRSSSGGFGSYQQFWGRIASAEASLFVASPVDGSISYRVRYTYRDGQVRDDSTRLHLLYDGTSFMIDAEG